ncbi:MAG: YvrJ family protein [Peptoniphilaceae bacterium]
MSIDEILTQIANTGFPIVVSCYLLVRIENKMNELTKSINDLNRTIESMIKY